MIFLFVDKGRSSKAVRAWSERAWIFTERLNGLSLRRLLYYSGQGAQMLCAWKELSYVHLRMAFGTSEELIALFFSLRSLFSLRHFFSLRHSFSSRRSLFLFNNMQDRFVMFIVLLIAYFLILTTAILSPRPRFALLWISSAIRQTQIARCRSRTPDFLL